MTCEVVVKAHIQLLAHAWKMYYHLLSSPVNFDTSSSKKVLVNAKIRRKRVDVVVGTRVARLVRCSQAMSSFNEHLSHLTRPVAARASPHKSECVLALVKDLSPRCLCPSYPHGTARSARGRVQASPARPSKRATTTPVVLRRAYAHHCSIPSLVAPSLYTLPKPLRVRRHASSHNGVPRHIPRHIRLPPPKRQ